LQTNAVQEALAADAVLSMNDPLQALKDSCTTTLAGEAVFRDDLDHMIDLFYEGAPSELRPALRELDPLRWARTARADAPGAELEEALDALWELYLERRLWLDTNQRREVRDARSAVERLIRALGDVGADRRAHAGSRQQPQPNPRHERTRRSSCASSASRIRRRGGSNRS
jgi:hypothetical protein